ncbi:recombinase family protein [Methylobacterium terricola]|uniref:Recombinase family protein n=1 Tax=Methylobacterium terricola TaxID=2583531 RepID=A0A5C4LNS3_9HYPH|nr:recombinase family protein [Methylobacterium terricola]TNC16502.1 recombinase family protein [Methylobacterium terricola]
MKRAAIYARFSTDLQNERSVEDQVAICRAYAQREGFAVVATYCDRAKSGASILGRDGLISLMAQAREHAFDAVIVEHSDRLARSMRDTGDLFDRFTFLGIELRSVHSGGKLDATMAGLFGLVGQMQREEGAKKVRRGMAGVIRSGRHAGGRAYGYRPVPGQRGELAIDEAEAAIVRRVLTEYANGRQPRDIASDLNREGVPPPRGRHWNASTINGNSARGTGLVFNELYVGRIVWNKVQMLKNPDTGRRVSRPNPKELWQAVEAPRLRIVSDDVWDRVRAVKATRTNDYPQFVRRQPYLLSGLLRCHACGSGLSVHDRDHTGKTRVRCSAVRESGCCDNRRIVYLPLIEQAVVSGMEEALRDRRLIDIYVSRYNEARRRLASGSGGERAKLESRLKALEAEHARLMSGYLKGFVTEADAAARLPTIKSEQATLEIELAQLSDTPNLLTIEENVVTSYLAQIKDLSGRLSDHARATDEASRHLVQTFRGLIETVTVLPGARRQGIEVEVKGRLTALVARGRPETLSGVLVVAEEGFEPPTQGL